MHRRAVFAAVPLLAAAVVAAPGPAPVAAQGAAQTGAAQTGTAHGIVPSSTLLVIVDDMRADEMAGLPRTHDWLAGKGAEFTHAYAPTPLCCPARATILTGQYSHNTGVYDNNPGGTYPGGFANFDDQLTLGTELWDAGITTGYIGKYLNGYGRVGTDQTYVPPGWDSWKGAIDGEYEYTGPTTYNINGKLVERRGYETDVEADMVSKFLDRFGNEPFFLQVNFLAPHDNVTENPRRSLPPRPPVEHRDDFPDYMVPRTEAYNELDVTDKPPNAQRPPLSQRAMVKIDHHAQKRLQTLLGVDDAMVQIRRQLRAMDIDNSTNVVLVSDNGFMLGEHRWQEGKVLGYEPSANIPLLMAGPDVGPPSIRTELVGLHDLAPTITQWFGLEPMPEADGMPLLGESSTATSCSAGSSTGRTSSRTRGCGRRTTSATGSTPRAVSSSTT